MTTPTLSQILLLVVEDSDEDFDTVEEVVRATGLNAEIRRAMTGDDCIRMLSGQAFASERPTIVLLDLNTPGLDGREALRLIKADTALASLPVVVHTTSANPRDLAFCYEVGANAYHVKPLRYVEHREVLSDVLNYWLTRVVLPEPRRPTP